MDVTIFNKVEKGTYVKPKSWAKEGIREVYCYLTHDRRLFLDCRLTDGKTIWFSETAMTEAALPQIFELLIETTKERNIEWHCTEQYMIRNACAISKYRLQYAVCLIVKLFEDNCRMPDGEELAYSENIGRQIVDRLMFLAENEFSKAQAVSPQTVEKLKLACNRIEEARYSDNPQQIQKAYLSLAEERRYIEGLEYLKLSQDENIREAFNYADEKREALYQANMRVSR